MSVMREVVICVLFFFMNVTLEVGIRRLKI